MAAAPAPPATSRAMALATVLGWVGIVAAGTAVVACARGDWRDAQTTLGSVLTALSWLLPGWVVARRRPDLPFGWLLLAGGLCLAVGFAMTAGGITEVLHGSSAGPWLAWVGGWIFFPHLGCQEAMYLLFPTGHLLSRRWRKVMVAVVLVNVATVAVAALIGGSLAGSGVLAHVDSPVRGLHFLRGTFPLVAIGQNVVNAAGIWVVYHRWRRAIGTERRILGLVLTLGVVDALVGVLLIAPIGGWIFLFAVPSTMGVTVAIAWGVLRHGLWDVRVIVRRTVTWLVLTGILVALLAAGLALAGRILGLVAASALATVVVVPLERRLRRAVDHLLFGDRLEPYAVLSSLGSDMEAAGDPVEALERLVGTIRASLKVSYAAVELVDSAGATTLAAAAGEPSGTVVRLAVRHHGRAMGSLVVGQHPGDRPFTEADRRLLDDLARQAGAAAASVALMTALQQSRQRLVSAREEERRRLRRELHDGVASALTAINLKVDSAAAVSSTDTARAQRILAGVQADVAGTLNEVRRVVADLRPPALEDLGLIGALTQLASRYDSPSLRVELDAAGSNGSAGGLPAAVELAFYRIAAEALQNVARHAEARSCLMRLAVDGSVATLTVADDGNGLIPTDGTSPGLGLPGMAERADELGGTLTAVPRRDDGPGSVVTASLPVGGAM
ncbi:MAG TPA: histidine kinase [Acidimicrobiales bacterium]|nr:histidine kinase [Acidimicrobiales bacterium]